jgi:hypothetical protein
VALVTVDSHVRLWCYRHTPALNWPDGPPKTSGPSVAIVLDCFGPHRLMCGSDWPVARLNGGYGRVWRLAALALALAAHNASNLALDGNARARLSTCAAAWDMMVVPGTVEGTWPYP